MEILSEGERRRVRWCRFVAYAGPVAAAIVTYSLIHAYAAYGPSRPVAGIRRGDRAFEWSVFAVNAAVVTVIAFGGVLQLCPVPARRSRNGVAAGLIAPFLYGVAVVTIAMAIDFGPAYATLLWRLTLEAIGLG